MRNILDALAHGEIMSDLDSMPDAPILFNDLFMRDNTVDFNEASEYLMTPVKTIRHWHREGKFPNMAHKLLYVRWRGYLPFTKKWKRCRFDEDENIVTPYGVCRPSDIAFIHKYKWAAEQSRSALDTVKQNTTYEAMTEISEEAMQKIVELAKVIEKINPHTQREDKKKAGNN